MRALVHVRTGIALTDAKREMLYGRLARRLRKLNLASFAKYCDLLEQGGAEELQELTNAITTNLTSFFRESHHFETLAGEAFPQIESTRSATRRIRLWSAGCSTGEEPYTIALVLRREIADMNRHDVKILATDIDTDVLAKASRGEYSAEALDHIPDPFCRYFKPIEESETSAIKVAPDVRSLITFRPLNLVQPWPMKGPFDAIFCRNVMIYFDAPTKAKLIERFVKLIKPGGWLYIGHSESLLGSHAGLHLMGRTIYRRDA